jgi:hypothetical protein
MAICLPVRERASSNHRSSQSIRPPGRERTGDGRRIREVNDHRRIRAAIRQPDRAWAVNRPTIQGAKDRTRSEGIMCLRRHPLLLRVVAVGDPALRPLSLHRY